eukprot:422768-Prymnesium_polylepis.1
MRSVAATPDPCPDAQVQATGGPARSLSWRAGVLARTLHLDQVDDTDEVGLLADGQLQAHRLRAEQVDDRLDAVVEVGARAVHLVEEAHARDAVLVRLAPDGLGLRLDTGDAIEAGDRAVEHTERTLDLQREVDVARR